MCRHHETWIAGLGGSPGQEAKRAVGDALSDIAEGLALSKHLQSLADGHWKECGHSGGLPLQGILVECARRISDQVESRRRELEGSGRVHFGAVVLEVSEDSSDPATAAVQPGGDLPFLAGRPGDPAGRFLSGPSLSAQSPEAPSPPPGSLRRIYSAVVARRAGEGLKWFAMGPK
jgi:hypothetical protein